MEIFEKWSNELPAEQIKIIQRIALNDRGDGKGFGIGGMLINVFLP